MHLKVFNPEMILSKEKTGKKKKRKKKQKLKERSPDTVPPRDQMPTLLLTPRSTCSQEPGMTGPWEVLPSSDQYRVRYSKPTIGADLRNHNGRARGRTGGAEGDCNPVGRTISANWTTQSFQRLNHQPKSIHGVSHGSTYICSRGRPYLTSIRGKALGPAVEAWCPSVGGC